MTADEFEVYENGRKQEVLYFDNEPRPVVIGLLIDTSGSMEGVKMERAKQGASAFLRKPVRPDVLRSEVSRVLDHHWGPLG